MKIIDCQQGTPEWFRARMGIPTASNFHLICTPAKGDYSKSARGYQFRLLAERLLKAPTGSVEGQQWMERGKELEPMAAAKYEFVYETETVPVGFITTDDGLIGASPDRLIKGQAAGLEIKCPAPPTHLEYLFDGPGADYLPQVQGQLLVAEFERVEFFSYHDRMPHALFLTHRDEDYIKKLRGHLDRFNAEMFDLCEKAKTLGVFQAYEEAATPTDIERAGEIKQQILDEFGIPP